MERKGKTFKDEKPPPRAGCTRSSEEDDGSREGQETQGSNQEQVPGI